MKYTKFLTKNLDKSYAKLVNQTTISQLKEKDYNTNQKPQKLCRLIENIITGQGPGLQGIHHQINLHAHRTANPKHKQQSITSQPQKTRIVVIHVK
jgi:hypothetical protein